MIMLKFKTTNHTSIKTTQLLTTQQLKLASIGIVILGTLLTSNTTHASTLYDESISGGLTRNARDNIFLLEEGVNSIFATQENSNIGPGTNFDSFTIELTEGQVLTSVSYRVTDIRFDTTSDVALLSNYRLLNDSGSSLTSTNIDVKLALSRYFINGSSLELFPDAMPIDTVGIYDFDNNSLSRGGNGTANGGVYDYEIHLNVTDMSAVPVPAAIWLIMSGLIGLAGVSRMKTI